MFRKEIANNSYLMLLETRHCVEMAALIDNSRKHLRRFLPWVDMNRSIDDSKFWIESTLKDFAANRALHAGIWYQGKLAGVIGYTLFWQNRSAAIGYWLGKDFQGKGLITSSCRTIIDYCFHDLQLNKVEIRCALENHRSQAVPKRLGFTQEGIIREAEWLYDHFVDHQVFGMLAREWENAQQ